MPEQQPHVEIVIPQNLIDADLKMFTAQFLKEQQVEILRQRRSISVLANRLRDVLIALRNCDHAIASFNSWYSEKPIVPDTIVQGVLKAGKHAHEVLNDTSEEEHNTR